MQLSINTTSEGATRTVHVAGEVDVSCADELRSAVDAALASGASTVEVDLAEVPYIDSTGIGVLVGAAHRASDAGLGLAVCNPQRNVSRVLGLLGVASDLNVRGAQQ